MTKVVIPVEDQYKRTEKIAMSIIKSNSKIYKLLSYNEIVNNPIYDHKWRESIKKELQNLKNHQI